MHEISLVRTLLSQVERIAVRQGGGLVLEIRLKCGQLAGVEPALLSSAFKLLQEDSNFSDAELIIEEVPVEANCQNCDAKFTPKHYCFTCPQCGSNNTNITQGDALILESIELQPLVESEP